MKIFIQKLNRERGQTIVMVTHEPDDRKYVNKVIWLKDGLVEKEEKIIETVRFLLDSDKLRYNSSQHLEWKN